MPPRSGCMFNSTPPTAVLAVSGRSRWDGWCPVADSPAGHLTFPFYPKESAMADRRHTTFAEQQEQAEACAKLASLPVRHRQAAGIHVGDATHWVCVDADGGDQAVRVFPAHTPGLRQLVTWLRHCGVTTVALEATGVYGHVLFLKTAKGTHLFILTCRRIFFILPTCHAARAKHPAAMFTTRSTVRRPG